MSMLSQQLQRTRLSRAEPSENPSSFHSGTVRHVSNTSSRLDRAVSSSSVTNRIDEEQPECVFSLDEEEYNGNRPSGASPKLGPIGDGRHGINAQLGLDSKPAADRPKPVDK
jgi:hypothetical protein